MADRPHPSSNASGPFDGTTLSYIPGPTLAIDPRLTLHREWTDKIDPITYEVIRHNLWNINEELGMTIQRISGSPVAMYAFDLNSSIFTEDGEFIYYGPYQLYMSGVSDVQVKWTLEHRSKNPGIFEDDMFLSNDPWVGAAHQMDVTLLAPVFWEGKLFCWITNVLHQYDVGGITPGSFCPNARDAFDEGILIPPVKIVERGELRKDIEGVYLRASRKPYLVALDLRAQIAGNNTAKSRVLSLIRRYGADVVKGVMRKIIDTAEQAFVQKLAKLPDGVWRERSYVEVAYVGDRKTYQVLLNMRKVGDRLIFDNAGTAPQVGAINTTYSGWRGSLMTAINELLCWDQLYAIGGALRHIEFQPALGAFTSAAHPASVSTAPVQAMEISLYPAYNTISKLLSGDPELKRDAMCIGGTSQFPLTVFRGIDQWGEKFGYLLLDPMVGAIGAFSFRDGIATGGQVRSPICRIGNVEHNEQSFPLLVLYRKENTDSGGAGRYRGGNSAVVGFIPHGTDHIIQDTESSGAAIPSAPGLMGGYPANTNYYQFKRQSDIQDWLGRRQIPGDIGEVTGEDVLLQLRQVDIHQGRDDVYEVAFAAGAGYGDPIERDPEAVRRDVYLGDISLKAARQIFRVELTGEGEELRVDAEATSAARRQAVVERLGGEPRPYAGPPLPRRRHLTEYLDLVDRDGHPWLGCARCGQPLCSARENYKLHCHRVDRPIQAA
ncbi:MAG TPA: hydantoinase B/oxoprolinase family protein, partial [Methylomirabilota bacterium]|nr:hydantoinase B/oxoprolinase family protein [Methylomirabilota bacterium]